jgi:hypothetical protein
MILNGFFGKFKLDEGFPPLDDCSSIKSEKELINHMAGRSWSRGLYRTLKIDSQQEWIDFIDLAFEGFKMRTLPFGCDWLGRLYCLDLAKVSNNRHLVLLVDPATFDTYSVPLGLLDFYNLVLGENHGNILNLEIFESKVLESNGQLKHDDCFGYRIPEFLGGEISIENLDRTNVKFYWELTKQIHDGLNKLPGGTKINGVSS